MDLFDVMQEKNRKSSVPLAERMRPERLEEVVGQEHIIGKNKLLYRAIQTDNLSSVIFYGPPGTGKTTLARIIANTTKSEFKQLNAVTSGVSDIRKVTEEASENLKLYGKKTILFIDEIHRFNKLQQDALLPFVENGTIILIGATTENPYFEVNRALISRSMIFELKPVGIEDIKKALIRAIESKKGFGDLEVEVDEDVFDYFALNSGGDVRKALNALEMAVLTSTSMDNKVRITIEDAVECMQKKVISYDKNGDNHYDIISAFIKSMRGSDPDAAVYYLAKMLEAGEDPKFIARRIVICASEDVGNADPMALNVAVSAAHAVDFIGMPEARIILSQAAIYVACAAKSNASYMAIDRAIEEVRRGEDSGVPYHLRDSHYQGAQKLGRGIGYKYPHDYEGGYIEQQYLPDSIKKKRFYIPSGYGYEARIKERLNKLRNK
ncbi:replication-associated recombination protein A [Fonticella tunisiensis]|uniref:Replication-associated recombination protein A n=1 Tax=Fonticella tunisiensis TaxID=1096341 RepID=A0A4R7KSN4_9CLOT|nr:replication-associated recombination protein A [Fonticella tunisiensis]TDT61998.1 putative ATPase [Fonticella tunisiensis]